jgi:very-short-patch-repair endonuclease
VRLAEGLLLRISQRYDPRCQVSGWRVVRIWEHDLKAEPMKCVKKIMVAIGPERD